ncbi:MAG: hypothetical protein JWM27_613 [Gemmatimonadetes bacterium]|nr:hypothetical protein [Gemmatimonadota bacterium]
MTSPRETSTVPALARLRERLAAQKRPGEGPRYVLSDTSRR